MKLRLLCLAVLPILAGCAGFRSCQLKRIFPKPVVQDEDISFAAKAFSHADCKLYLDRNLIRAGYQPIQIAIENNSCRYLEFSTDNMNLPTVPANIVAESVYQSVVARALGYGIPGLFLWPFLIPAVADSLWAAEANKKLLQDYLAKSVQDKTIVPDSHLEGLIFVSNNNYQNKLDVTLIDRDSNEKIVCSSYL